MKFQFGTFSLKFCESHSKLTLYSQGEYNFTLTVYDEKGATDKAMISVTVEKNPHSHDIVQVYLFEDPSNFTQERLESLTNILMVPFSEFLFSGIIGHFDHLNLAAYLFQVL